MENTTVVGRRRWRPRSFRITNGNGNGSGGDAKAAGAEREREKEGGTEGETHIQPARFVGWLDGCTARADTPFVRQELDIALLRVDEF